MVAPMTQSEQFVADVEAFLKANNLTPSAFGREALNDPSFVLELRRGRKPGLGSVDKVYEFMRAKAQTTEAT